MANFYLQEIWRRAEKALSSARRIVFCGYSFPDADIHVKYLLKRVEVNRVCTPQIYVVNNHALKSNDQKVAEENRYKRFFIDRKKVHYTDHSFEDFCKSGFKSF